MSDSREPIECVYSTMPDDWFRYHDSLEEIITNDDVEEGSVIYCGEKQPIDVSSLISVDSIIDDMAAQAEDLIDTSTYDNPIDDVSDEAKKELGEFLDAWARKHVEFNAFHIVNIKELTITQEMIALAENNELPESGELAAPKGGE